MALDVRGSRLIIPTIILFNESTAGRFKPTKVVFGRSPL